MYSKKWFPLTLVGSGLIWHSCPSTSFSTIFPLELHVSNSRYLPPSTGVSLQSPWSRPAAGAQSILGSLTGRIWDCCGSFFFLSFGSNGVNFYIFPIGGGEKKTVNTEERKTRLRSGQGIYSVFIGINATRRNTYFLKHLFVILAAFCLISTFLIIVFMYL